MAKKKAKPLEREERPEFLAMLASLPDDTEAMHARAGHLRAIYNDAIIAGDEAARAAATLEHDAIVFKLNGGTFFGCRGDDTRPGRVLDAQHAAKPGQVPHWGQDGEFLVEVDGVRVLVKYECQGLRSAPGFDATAVDFDKPFISPTGYRGVYFTVTDHMGRTLEQAVRAEIAAQIAAEGLTPIKKEDLRWIEKRPGWLVDVLEGVTRDGQLAMFGDQPAPKKPLSGAERQKRRREKLRKLKEAEGLKPVLLTERERAILQAALALDHESRPLPDPDYPARLALLDKLAPENGDPERVAPPSLLNLSPGVPELERVWNRLPTDFSRAATTIGILRLRNSQHAELLRAVEVLQARLRKAGLSDDLGRWHWNQTPPRDYRPTTPPEYLERISCDMTMSWGDDDPTRNL